MAAPARTERAAVVGEAYCARQPMTLIMTHKPELFVKTPFQIQDANQNLMFQVKSHGHAMHRNRVLCDTSDTPIVTMRDKVMSMSNRWMVYRGDSTEKKDLLYTVKNTKFWQSRPNLDVFLASNESDDKCDFHLEGRNSTQTCTIYKGDDVIAEVRSDAVLGVMLYSKDSMMVSVGGGVDYAFIISLITIYYEIKIAQNIAIVSGATSGAIAGASVVC